MRMIERRQAAATTAPRRPARQEGVLQFRTVALAAALSLASLVPAFAAPLDGQPGQEVMPATRFKCQDGGELTARFDTRGARLVAIVDDGQGAHALPIKPWTGGPVQLTWSDGARTLTWSPGVQIMWMDNAGAHRMCGREGGHHH